MRKTVESEEICGGGSAESVAGAVAGEGGGQGRGGAAGLCSFYQGLTFGHTIGPGVPVSY